jgi:hypothetical protein
MAGTCLRRNIVNSGNRLLGKTVDGVELEPSAFALRVRAKEPRGPGSLSPPAPIVSPEFYHSRKVELQTGSGLQGMRERVRQLKGGFEIESSPSGPPMVLTGGRAISAEDLGAGISEGVV